MGEFTIVDREAMEDFKTTLTFKQKSEGSDRIRLWVSGRSAGSLSRWNSIRKVFTITILIEKKPVWLGESDPQ